MDSFYLSIYSVFQSSIFLLLSVLILLITYFKYKLTFWRRQGLPNDIFHTYRSLSNILHLIDLKCVQNNGKIVGTYQFLSPTLLLAEPKLINQVLVEDFQKFSSHSVWATPNQVIGRSLALLDYNSWKFSRHLIVPVFSFANIKKIENLFNDSIKVFLNDIERYTKVGKSFDIKPLFETLALNNILKAFFETEVNSSDDLTNPLFINLRKIFNKNLSTEQLISHFCPLLARILGFRAIDKKATDFMSELIRQKMRERNKSKRNDLLQVLIDSTNDNQKTSKTRLDDQEVVDNCISFLINGYTTTSSALSNLCYHLISNPSAQENLIKEFDDKLNGIEPNIDDLKNLEYLDACIQESMRLEPPVVRIERRTASKCKLGNIVVPKGTSINIPVKTVHRDRDNFENPDEFKPERFLSENLKKIKLGTYLSFADGPRNCVGMRFALIEMKLCLAKLFQNYRFVKCSETVPFEYYCGQVVTSPKCVILKVKRRSWL